METLKDAVISLQNYNGGGLATDATGKFESCRHALAKLDNEKITLGQAATKVRAYLKKQGLNITINVNYLLNVYQKINNRLPEWHHAGMLPKHYGGGMKKTYFINVKDVEQLINYIVINANYTVTGLQEQEQEQIIYGYYWVWEQYTGNYGKKKWAKRLEFFEGKKSNAPAKNFTEISKQTYLDNKIKAGKLFYGFDTPTF